MESKIFKKLFYTVPEAAELLQVHPNTIYKMTRNKELEYYRVSAQIRIPAEALEQLKVSRESNTESSN